MYKFWFMLLAVASLLYSCGGDEGEPLAPSTQTGEIVINVTWPQSASADKRTDAEFQVSYITAYLYSGEIEITYTELTREENRGIGEIKVTVGEDYRLELVAFEIFFDYARIYYLGIKENIDVIADETTTVDITMVEASPVLQPAKMLGENSYSISWTPVLFTTIYNLGEDTSIDFSSATTVYSGPDTTTTLTDKTPGIYHYSIFAETPYGNAVPSEPITVEVGSTGTIKINIPWPGE
ncbi:MAG TPA: hypothetical protein ENH82_14005 [bacterium]|nr:hypothetical protein [bacterium]